MRESVILNLFAQSQLVKDSLISQMKRVIISVTHGFGKRWRDVTALLTVTLRLRLVLAQNRLKWS